MTSLRARLVNLYLRAVMKPKRLDEMAPVALRAFTERAVIPLLPKGVARERVDGALKGEWQRPARAARTILYLHGGGYVFGSPRTHRTLTYPLALAAEANVFSLDYRLAPEHPCPAAIEDALAAYDFLLGLHAPEKIVIAGDSAGGGLALAALVALKERGAPLPAGAILYSPWTDLTVSGETMAANARSDAMFNRASIEGGRWKYLGRLDPKDPRASPLYADLGGLPPLLVFASRSEMLFDDSRRLVEKAKAAGLHVDFVAADNLVHVWPLFHPFLPEAREALMRSGECIRTRTLRA
ncbi:MAG: alpha/beta hydrolase [Amphiplicatus sp.]